MKLFLSGSGMKKNECSAGVCRGRCVFMVEYTDITHELIHRAIDRGTRTGKAANSSIQFDPPEPCLCSKLALMNVLRASGGMKA